MYLEEFLKEYNNKNIKLFVDMDGVIADYDFGNAGNFDTKRPLYDSIKKLEKVSKNSNIKLFIFSATRHSEGIEQKHFWLDKYAPFFKKENRIILSREDNDYIESSILKSNYLKELQRDGSILMVIDDDPRNLKEIRKNNKDVVLLKDSVLVD